MEAKGTVTDHLGHCIRCTTSINSSCEGLLNNPNCHCTVMTDYEKPRVMGVQTLTARDLEWLTTTTDLSFGDFNDLEINEGDAIKLCLACKAALIAYRKSETIANPKKRKAQRILKPSAAANRAFLIPSTTDADQDSGDYGSTTADEVSENIEPKWRPMSIPVTLLPGIGSKTTVGTIVIKLVKKPSSILEVLDLIQIKSKLSDEWVPFKQALYGKSKNSGNPFEITALSDFDGIFLPFQEKGNGIVNSSFVVYETKPIGGKADGSGTKKGKGTGVGEEASDITGFVVKLRNKYPDGKLTLESGIIELGMGHFQQWAFQLSQRKVGVTLESPPNHPMFDPAVSKPSSKKAENTTLSSNSGNDIGALLGGFLKAAGLVSSLPGAAPSPLSSVVNPTPNQTTVLLVVSIVFGANSLVDSTTVLPGNSLSSLLIDFGYPLEGCMMKKAEGQSVRLKASYVSVDGGTRQIGFGQDLNALFPHGGEVKIQLTEQALLVFE
ncbi:hypothetical protein BCR33DRAFT_779865 [Rhizoclosmatium globosum]|uniref:Uncharacterized protein n=1 Tax=Rhizoclosmatium globosum TaxID=329046 RepID=A0A1Y2CZX7_9FUNG|nr:hypothetical protein BCR33DRAFT_779865 [Rhizoclosmatium globosum]|eukprot:ORY52602.1 hypothetical protein BCR33DRAFT_779865 [Rhizoclosmatium globosum]